MPDFSSIVILTGAGVSAESGLQTFRAADGLWEGHRVEDFFMSAFDPLRTFADARYSSPMRTLWPIEKAVLDATAQDYPAYAASLLQQIETAQVTAFENTGAGFFSTVSVPSNAPRLPDKSPLDGAHGSVDGVEDAMGFIVFIEDGRLALIEGYSQTIESTVEIDFATVEFDLRPFGAGYAQLANVRFPPKADISA